MFSSAACHDSGSAGRSETAKDFWRQYGIATADGMQPLGYC